MPITLEEAQQEAHAELILTERWHPLRYHEQQSLLMHHAARFKECAAGRRSGKTETAKRDAVLNLVTLGWNKEIQTVGIGAPTASRVKKIYYEDIRALIPKHWIKDIRESLNDMQFITHWGARLILVGLGSPQIVEGFPWSIFYSDETPDTPPNWIKNNLRAALATPGHMGRAWYFGVPDEAGSNQAEYEELWERGLQWPKFNHCAFWWPSSDIVPAEEIVELSSDMDEFTYRQEILGQFVKSGNKAVPQFNPVYHVDDYRAEYSPFLPLDHTFDFGVRPVVSLVGQQYRNSIWIVDEISLDDSSTDVTCREFLSRAGMNGWSLDNGIRIFGDAAGRTPGSNVGKSDYEIIREEYSAYPHEFHNLFSDPPVKDTINAVRRAMLDRLGIVRIYIASRCKRLIHDLKSAPWPDNLREYHALAALRYYIYSLSSFGKVQSGITGIGRANITENQRVSARYTRR